MQSQALHLQSLEGNPGILPVKEGQAYIETDHWTIVKVINLEKLYNDLNYISINYQHMCELIDWNTSYSQEFNNIKLHTEFIRDLTIDKYHQLIPHQRSKRGIVNPLGSVIKFITGNLDHEDAIKYEKLISKLDHNQVIISNKITLISRMFDSFINATDTINQNSVNFQNRLTQVELILRDLSAQQNNWVYLTYITGLFNVFISSFRTIFIRISEIETAISLSRLSILHPCIVNSSELLYHLRLISSSESLVYKPDETNLLKLEETITVKSFIKDHKLTFIMKIPITDNCTYNYYKLYSLPIFHESGNKTLTIFPEYPYLLAKGMKYLPIVKPCQALLAGDNFLCTPDNHALYYEPSCMEQLMKFDNDHSHCEQHQIEVEEVKIQQINMDNWILYSRIKTTLNKHCNNDISKQPIFGTYIITLNEPCNVEIEGIKIHHRVLVELETVKPIPIIALPRLPVNLSSLSTRALDMKGVNLDEVKYMVSALKHSEVIRSVLSEQNDSKSSVFLGYTSIGLVILSCLVFLIYRLRLKLLKMLLSKQNSRIQSQIDSSDNFPLRDGGVMVHPHPSPLD